MNLDTSSIGTSRLHPEPLSRLIYEWLRERILSGQLKPGEVLRQERLAKHFDVSRVPLREALSRLEAEGLVVLRQRRGYAVSSLNPAEIVEVLQLRMVMEEHAGYVATRVRTEEHVRRLRQCLERMDRLALVKPSADELEQWALANDEFHTVLFSASGRQQLCRISKAVRAKVEPYIRLEVAEIQSFEEAQADHREIYAAFEKGNAGRVGTLSRQHARNTAMRLIQALHARGFITEVPLRSIGEIRSGLS